MTILLDMGDFWIEHHSVNVTVGDAQGGHVSSNVNLDRTGRIVGAAIVNSAAGSLGDNADSIGTVNVRQNGVGPIVYGSVMSTFNVRVIKRLGTEGNITQTYNVMFFMKK